MQVNYNVTPTGNYEATSRRHTPAGCGRNRVRGEHQPTPNFFRASTPHMVATTVGAVAGAAMVVVPPTTAAEELVAEAIAEAEAMQTAMPPAIHTAATMPATGLTRFHLPRRLPK
jgi:hypothetical protein